MNSLIRCLVLVSALGAACGSSDISDPNSGGSDDMSPSAMGLTCAPDDPAYVTKALGCYPACMQRILGPCLGQGTCVSGGLYLGNGNMLVKYSFANCIEAEGEFWVASVNKGTVKKDGALCYTYELVVNSPDPSDQPLTITSARGSFLIHHPHQSPQTVECDGSTFPLNLQAGCNGIVLENYGTLQYSTSCH